MKRKVVVKYRETLLGVLFMQGTSQTKGPNVVIWTGSHHGVRLYSLWSNSINCIGLEEAT